MFAEHRELLNVCMIIACDFRVREFLHGAVEALAKVAQHKQGMAFTKWHKWGLAPSRLHTSGQAGTGGENTLPSELYGAMGGHRRSRVVRISR